MGENDPEEIRRLPCTRVAFYRENKTNPSWADDGIGRRLGCLGSARRWENVQFVKQASQKICTDTQDAFWNRTG